MIKMEGVFYCWNQVHLQQVSMDIAIIYYSLPITREMREVDNVN